MIIKKIIEYFKKFIQCFFSKKIQGTKKNMSNKKEQSIKDKKNILSLDFESARIFLLKDESYINIDLPPYLKFSTLLEKISQVLEKNNLTELKKLLPEKKQNAKKNKRFEPKDFENVNYKLLHNKNGKYDWRQFELINPVLYASLVKEITKEDNWKTILERFLVFKENSIIECMSLPIVSVGENSDKAEQILNWWEQIEQKSLELSLDFNYVFHTDIADCYGSIYTHSIPWALHSKEIAKKDRGNKNLIGNIIDTHIQAMSFGQTNGIPQGSVLMDFIAEMVLSYADLELSEKIKHISKEDFKILRYRDDYRIFVNSPQIADQIIKYLTEVLIELGLKLHSQKTTYSNNVIQGSIKADKLQWLIESKDEKTIQKRLLHIHKFSLEYPNSGTLVKELQTVLRTIHNSKKLKERENILVLISIVIDITFLNPRTYSVSIAIISSLLKLLNNDEVTTVVKKIMRKFDAIPNTGYMQIWLQRAIIKLEISDIVFDEYICKLVNKEKIELWNNEWLNENIKNIFKDTCIVDYEGIDNLDTEISEDEVQLFGVYSS